MIVHAKYCCFSNIVIILQSIVPCTATELDSQSGFALPGRHCSIKLAITFVSQSLFVCQDHHDELLQALLSACITDADKIHLQSTVQQLVSTVPLDGTRTSKDKFRKNLKDYLPTLRGYLCVK